MVEVTQQPFSCVKVGEARSTDTAPCKCVNWGPYPVRVSPVNAELLRCCKSEVAAATGQDSRGRRPGVLRSLLPGRSLFNGSKLGLCDGS